MPRSPRLWSRRDYRRITLDTFFVPKMLLGEALGLDLGDGEIPLWDLKGRQVFEVDGTKIIAVFKLPYLDLEQELPPVALDFKIYRTEKKDVG